MSHVAMQTTKAGQPLYVDLACLKKAVEMIGLEVVETNKYTWYNRHVGDYPLPAGMKASDLGHNALFVLRVAEPLRSQLRAKHHREPYDIGVLEDPLNPGCYTLIYDFYSGGYGLHEVVGVPVYGAGGYYAPDMLCPKLKQAYDQVCDSVAAVEAGDSIEFMSMAKAAALYPQYFPHSDDEETMVSIARTEARLGV